MLKQAYVVPHTVRYLSTVKAAVENKSELPYVHIGDRVIVKGKSYVSKSSTVVRTNPTESETSKKMSYRNVSTNYIFDRNIARRVAALISPRHSERNLFVEINPGIGCLTAELLNCGFKLLHLIEANQSFLEYLQIYSAFSQHVTVSNQRFSYYGDAMSNSSVWINKLSRDWSWDSDPQVSVFTVIPPRQERFLIPWLVNMISSWNNFGRFRYFLIVSDRLLWRFTDSEIATSGNFKHYTVGHILASTLFEMKLLTKMNKSDFVPPVTMSSVEQKAKSKKGRTFFESSSMAITMVEPKQNLNKLLALSDCLLYAAFVRQLTARRHARVIPTVERLLPGIGLELLDFPEITSPSTRIGDLRPSAFLQIFQTMKKSPHFVPELFMPSINTPSISLSNAPVPDSINDILEPPPIRFSPSSRRKPITKTKEISRHAATNEQNNFEELLEHEEDMHMFDSDSDNHSHPLHNNFDCEDDMSMLYGHNTLL